MRHEFGNFAILIGHRNRIFRGQFRRAHIYGNIILPHQKANAFGQPVGDLARAFDCHRIIQVQILERKTKLLAAFPQDLGNIRILEQRLGWNAADIQTYPAQPLLVNNGGFLPELGRTDGGHIARRSRADDNNIISVRHRYLRYYIEIVV